MILKFYLVFFSFTVLYIYALLLGDVGYLEQKRKRENLATLEDRVFALKSKNKYWNQEYLKWKNKNTRESSHAGDYHVTILKFIEGKEEDLGLEAFLKKYNNELAEWRLFFLLGSFLIGCFGYLYIKKQQGKSYGRS